MYFDTSTINYDALHQLHRPDHGHQHVHRHDGLCIRLLVGFQLCNFVPTWQGLLLPAREHPAEAHDDIFGRRRHHEAGGHFNNNYRLHPAGRLPEHILAGHPHGRQAGRYDLLDCHRSGWPHGRHYNLSGDHGRAVRHKGRRRQGHQEFDLESVLLNPAGWLEPHSGK